MGISGVLEHFPFSEFLQTLGNLNKTGTVHLSRFAEKGVLVLRDGRVIGASLSTFRETLGSLLLGQQLITEEELAQALELQKGLAEETRLGAILVDRGMLESEELENVVHQQILRVVREFMQWKHGAFEFSEMAIEDHGESGSEVADLLLSEGMSAEGLLLASAVELDHMSAEEGEEHEEGESGRFVSMRDLLLEIRSLEFTGELSTRIMGYAADLVSRSVLFTVQGGHFCGLGCHSTVPPDTETIEAVRDLRLSAMEPSILADCAARHRACKGPLADSACNNKIIQALGGVVPQEAVAVPLIVDGRVAMILYGDVGSGDQPIGPVAELEVLMIEVGLVLERDQALGIAEGENHAKLAVAERLPPDEFKRLLDDDPEPLIVVDANCSVRYVNKSCGDLVGKEPEELIGSGLEEFLHPNDGLDLKDIVEEVTNGGAPGGKATRFVHANGTVESLYLLPSAVGGESDRCVMLRALTATASHRRHDPLTGLIDNEELRRHIERDIARLRENPTAVFAILLVGIDQFTLINVTYGWGGGNQLLRAVGDRLGEYLRPGDVVSRKGGDEFCVLLERIRSAEDAELVATRILEALSHPFTVRGDEAEIAVSVGVVSSHPDYKNPDDLLADAEAAMQTAKLTHGSAIQVHNGPDKLPEKVPSDS